MRISLTVPRKKSFFFFLNTGFAGGSVVKSQPAMQEIWALPHWEDPLEKEMATYPNILACEIPWTEEPGGLQSMGSQESDTTKRLNNNNPPTFLSSS